MGRSNTGKGSAADVEGTPTQPLDLRAIKETHGEIGRNRVTSPTPESCR